MSRPKGSKNKVQSSFGKNYQTVISNQPEISKEDIQSLAEYNATLNEQDATLDTFLMETVDNTLATIEKDYMPIQQISMRKKILSLMSQIHAEIAPAINEMRKGLTMGFCREEDKFIPENQETDYVKLIGMA